MDLPMLGTHEQRKTTQFQVMLVDKQDKTLHPMQQPKINRFFDDKADRDAFVIMFEQSVLKAGGRLKKDPHDHPLFISFDVLNPEGIVDYSITIYH